jgi:hypothetical protein
MTAGQLRCSDLLRDVPNQVRRVRLNQPHRAQVTPSW